MKKLKLSVIATLFAFSFLAHSVAKAGDNGNNGNHGNGNHGNGNNGNDDGGGSTGLPINNGVWFLLAAGAVIGCKVVINKNKELKAV